MESENKIVKQVNGFGGISFVMAKMKQLGIPELFDSMLGTRVKQARYSYSDVFLGWVYCNLCGAKRIEDIYTENLHNTFQQIPIAKLCSPDSVGRIFKRFATPADKHLHKHKKNTTGHEFNSNSLMNDLLLQFSKSVGVLKESESYLLDFDATMIPTEKADAKLTYKEFRGYSPSIGMIGKLPVFIEGRNGNSPASYRAAAALAEMYERLQHNGINTWGIRMDAAYYQLDIIDLLVAKQQKFYIRATNTDEKKSDFNIGQYRKAELENRPYDQIANVEFEPFKDRPAFRFVILRRLKRELEEERKKLKKLGRESELGEPKPEDYVVRAIITNDMEKYRDPLTGERKYVRSDEDVVRLYDLRGDAENNFRDLLNDFNWRRVPFQNMNENLVFMYVSAMAKILFEYLLQQFGEHTTSFQEKVKLKKFVAYFVRRVAVQWLQQGDGWTLELLNLKEKFEALQSWAIRK